MGATVIDDVSLLKASTQPRSGTPDGNIHFNVVTGEVEIIIDSELANYSNGGSTVSNVLTLDSKPTLRAIYALHQALRESDESFRQYRPFLAGRFKLAGSYDFVYGRTAGPDRTRISGSGWREFGGAVGTQLNRIYFSTASLPSILDASQGFYQLAENGPTADFTRPGAFNEAVQVFGTTANGDTGAGNFDTRDYLAVSVRSYGQRHGRVALEDFGTSELEGYAVLAALGESPHPTTGGFDRADVYGGSAIAPFSGISFDMVGSAETKTGFNESDGAFSLVVRNAAGAGLDQVIAWIDAAAQEDADIADTGTWNGKRREQLYAFDANGVPTFIPGVFIEGLLTSDLQRLNIFDDTGEAKTFPFAPSVQVAIPDVARDTVTGWYHAYVFDGSGAQDYNTSNAVTMRDQQGNEVKGNIGALTNVSFGVAYDSNTLAGLTPGQDFQVIFKIGSDGEFVESNVIIDITRTAIIPATIATSAENNI